MSEKLNAVGHILQTGALERYFRYEGKMNEHVVALPVYKSRLRLYCLRMSDSVLIIGNGGKKDTKTYEESSELNGYVISLQKLDTLISEGVKDGSVTIEQTTISIDEDKTFNFLKFYNDHEFNELNEFSMQDVMMHLRCNEFHELASAGKKSLAISFVKFV